jgi:hypothetical protein
VFRPEAGLLRLGFQRLDFVPGATAESVARQAANPEDGWFDVTQLQPAVAAGNTPRNFLRGQPSAWTEHLEDDPARRSDALELRWRSLQPVQINRLPENNFRRGLGRITSTIGAPACRSSACACSSGRTDSGRERRGTAGVSPRPVFTPRSRIYRRRQPSTGWLFCRTFAAVT